MNLLSIHCLSKAVGDKQLFSEISFGIDAGQKTALIGNNGSGKTTLLRLLAGQSEPDAGTIAANNELGLAYLEQIPRYNPQDTVIEHILNDDSPVMNLIREYESCLEELQREATPQQEKRLAELIGRLDQARAWTMESRIKSVLSELGITGFAQRMQTLSGGMLKKVDLARALVSPANLLLLDEPTNHLDLATIGWLEAYLQRTNQAVLIVTHDRYFLDKICQGILELEAGRLLRYQGNYSYYLEKKAEQQQARDKTQERIQTVLRTELAWLRRGPKARGGKSKSRKERIIDLMNKRESASLQQAEFSVTHRRLGKKVLELHGLGKAFGTKTVIKPFSYSFKQGERIGLIGPNGSGKTTFLNLLSQRLDPDSGRVDAGINTHFGYFAQLCEVLADELTILEYLRQTAEHVRQAERTLSIPQLLEAFSFPRSMLNTRIRYLSGGEKRRLYLVNVLLSSPNFLVLDEPTNNLDIRTLSLLEDFLLGFRGCFTVVSHDRYFLDRTVDFLFIFDGQGNISGFGGNYSQYQEYYRDEPAGTSEPQAQLSTPKPEKKEPQPPTAKKKLGFNEKREYEALGAEITRLEDEQRELENFFSSGETDGSKLKKAQERYAEIARQLEAKMERWLELAELAD